MNLQRREEIRELIAEIARYEELGATLDLEGKARDAITELLAHIDALEQAAAERVIARGAVVKPHTFGEIVNQVRDIAIQYTGTEQLRERIAYALAPHFERNAGPTPDYTGEGSAWVPPVEARAVVVPLGDTFTLDLDEFGKSLACITINSKNRGVGYQLCGTMGDGHFSRRTFDITPYLGHCLNLIGIRAIPAGRALGEGMVAVTPEYLDAAWGLDDMSDLEMFMWFRDNQEESGSDAQRVAKIFWREAQEWKKHQRKKFDALRASQGGANE